MMIRHIQLFASVLLLLGLISCSQGSVANNPPSPTLSSSQPSSTLPPANTAEADLSRLFSRPWQVTRASVPPAYGALFIFLPNGTLLETSCVETYRIATWTTDQKSPRVLRVTEDGRLAFTATIDELSDTTLQLRQTLLPGNERKDMTLTSVDQEFICRDLPR